MGLCKVTKYLGLTLLWISILDRVCTYSCHTDTSLEPLLLISKNPSHSFRTSAFLIFILTLKVKKRLLPNSGKKCFFFVSYTRPSLTSNLCYSNGNWVLNYTLSVCLKIVCLRILAWTICYVNSIDKFYILK